MRPLDDEYFRDMATECRWRTMSRPTDLEALLRQVARDTAARCVEIVNTQIKANNDSPVEGRVHTGVAELARKRIMKEFKL